MISEAEMLDAIRLVDRTFKSPAPTAKLQIWFGTGILIIPGLAIMLLGAYFAFIISRAVTVLPIDTILTALLVVAATYTLGITFIFIEKPEERIRRLKERYYFPLIRGEGEPLILRALLRMRIALPKDVTLEEMYDRNKAVFKSKELLHRLMN